MRSCSKTLCLAIRADTWVGGKIVSPIRSERGYKYLQQPPREQPCRSRAYGGHFEDYETSGLDECAATIAECLYPEEPSLASRRPIMEMFGACISLEVAGAQLRLTTDLRSLPLRVAKKVKFQESTLSEGFCGMFLPRAEKSIALRFDPRLVPYLGICLGPGGWPTSRADKHFTVAVASSIGRSDPLEDAVRRNACAVRRGHESMQRWTEIEVNGGAAGPFGCADE